MALFCFRLMKFFGLYDSGQARNSLVVLPQKFFLVRFAISPILLPEVKTENYGLEGDMEEVCLV